MSKPVNYWWLGTSREEDISHQLCVCVCVFFFSCLFLKDSWCFAVPTTNMNLWCSGHERMHLHRGGEINWGSKGNNYRGKLWNNVLFFTENSWLKRVLQLLFFFTMWKKGYLSTGWKQKVNHTMKTEANLCSCQSLDIIALPWHNGSQAQSFSPSGSISGT